MKIKKKTFSTLVLELFFPSIANCKKLKIRKSTSPTTQFHTVPRGQIYTVSQTGFIILKVRIHDDDRVGTTFNDKKSCLCVPAPGDLSRSGSD
jgi:hypothetical protein